MWKMGGKKVKSGREIWKWEENIVCKVTKLSLGADDAILLVNKGLQNMARAGVIRVMANSKDGFLGEVSRKFVIAFLFHSNIL